MVDNKGINPIPSFNFKAGDASGMANKMSEEKYGQGGEYFLQDENEEENQEQKQEFQDRSAQLRASLNGLAMANAGSIRLMKFLREKEEEEKKKRKQQNGMSEEEEALEEAIAEQEEVIE